MPRSKDLVFYSWIPLSPEVSRLSPYTHVQQHTRTSRTFYTFAVPPTRYTINYPSIDWKKSFNRSSTHAWGLRDRLSQAVKIRTSRLYFSRRHAPSATVALAGITARDLATGSMTWLPLLVPPTVPPAAPRRDGGDPALMGSSFVALDPPGIFGLHAQVRQ